MNPVIILWAHPRSMSTAIERVMRERGDFDCLHEPFLHYYYLERSRRGLPHFDSEQGHPTSYAATRDLILQRASRSPVFVKDMSYYVMPEILDDAGFCRRVRHCFLIRNPMLSITSYYRLDPDVTLAEIGIEAQWRQYDGLLQMGIDDSLVLEAEAVQADTAAAMRCFWGALGLDYREQALTWQRDSTPADWQYVQGWHRRVADSCGITQPTVNLEEAGIHFDRFCGDAPRLREYLQHHLPYYQRLKAHRLGSGDGGREI